MSVMVVLAPGVTIASSQAPRRGRLTRAVHSSSRCGTVVAPGGAGLPVMEILFPRCRPGPSRSRSSPGHSPGRSAAGWPGSGRRESPGRGWPGSARPRPRRSGAVAILRPPAAARHRLGDLAGAGGMAAFTERARPDPAVARALGVGHPPGDQWFGTRHDLGLLPLLGVVRAGAQPVSRTGMSTPASRVPIWNATGRVTLWPSCSRSGTPGSSARSLASRAR